MRPKSCCLLSCIAAVECGYVMTDSNIRTAVNEWEHTPGAAEATYGHISNWKTGKVTDMANLCINKRTFNDDVGAWDTSSVTSMRQMFTYATSFNQDLSDWRVENVKDMNGMFSYAENFNQDLGWCVESDTHVDEDSFKKTKCESTLCGVAKKDVIGLCEPFAKLCLIKANKSQCIINSPTLIIIIVLIFLAGFGACVHRRKKKDETYIAAARRLLCRRSKTDPGDVSSRPDSPAESPSEEATPPKEEEAAAIAPEAEESPPQETLIEEPPPQESPVDEPPPPPAKKSWSFWRAEPEPEQAERPPPLSPFSALRAEREQELKTLASP